MVSVKGASAMASEPRYISPSPWPMASGGPCRAPIIRLSSPAKMMASAKAPRSRCSAALAASTGARPAIEIVADEVQHRLGVGLGLEHVALGGQRLAQLLEVLDDAVVHDGDALVHVRVGVALDRLAVGRPARMAEAGVPLQRMVGEPQLQVLELALGAAAVEMAVLDGGNARRIIAAILEPPQRVDEVARHRLLPEDADDAAHALSLLRPHCSDALAGRAASRVPSSRDPPGLGCYPRCSTALVSRSAGNDQFKLCVRSFLG